MINGLFLKLLTAYMKLLVISNGHGEDIIAVRIIEQLQLILPQLQIFALPIVGEGHAYQKASIPLAGRVQTMPSGGFVYMSGEKFLADLQGGLLALTLEQLRIVRQWGKTKQPILAVGDIVPLLFARLSGSKYAFVGTAKSEYYLRNSEGQWLEQTSWLERKFGSVYLPWERWLMSGARGIYPRDSLTCQILAQQGISAVDTGNPMMDGLIDNRHRDFEPHKLRILLLPGSRRAEALANWQTILEAVGEIRLQFAQYHLTFYAAIAPGLNLEDFSERLPDQWCLKEETNHKMLLQTGTSRMWLANDSYGEFLEKADMAIAMAGTATEQFVGLGKPAITMSGAGAQCTPSFMEAQNRLLGDSVLMVESIAQIPPKIQQLLVEPELRQKIKNNGLTRMGTPGAAARIAQHLQRTLIKMVSI